MVEIMLERWSALTPPVPLSCIWENPVTLLPFEYIQYCFDQESKAVITVGCKPALRRISGIFSNSILLYEPVFSPFTSATAFAIPVGLSCSLFHFSKKFHHTIR